MRPWSIAMTILFCAACSSGKPGGANQHDGGGSGSGSGTGTGTGSGSDDADARIGEIPDADEGSGSDDIDAGSGSGTDDIDAGPSGICSGGLGAWTGHDDVASSQSPPCGLTAKQVPQFVAIGFDDNEYSGLPGSNGMGGLTWATDLIRTRKNKDGTPARLSFYLTTIYIDVWESESPTYVKRAWHTAMTDGHEIGDHTINHNHGDAFDVATWHTEMQGCIDSITKPFDPNEVNYDPDKTKGIGANKSKVYGFRTPFLEYEDNTLTAEQQIGFRYDCSIEDGWQEEQDGTDYTWPYTLDHGSAGHDVLVGWGSKKPLTPHPGLWEMSVHPVIVPPDDKCAQYGVPTGFRDRMHAKASWFDVDSGKITGFDYNLWVSFQMTKAEFLATMKYTFDLRYNGNRAPFMFGAHTGIYNSKYTAATGSTVDERQQAMQEFLDYVLSKSDARVRSNEEILEWVRNPVPL
jgi:hypothetical protein